MSLEVELHQNTHPMMNGVSQRTLPQYGIRDSTAILYVADLLAQFSRPSAVQIKGQEMPNQLTPIMLNMAASGETPKFSPYEYEQAGIFYLFPEYSRDM